MVVTLGFDLLIDVAGLGDSEFPSAQIDSLFTVQVGFIEYIVGSILGRLVFKPQLSHQFNQQYEEHNGSDDTHEHASLCPDRHGSRVLFVVYFGKSLVEHTLLVIQRVGRVAIHAVSDVGTEALFTCFVTCYTYFKSDTIITLALVAVDQVGILGKAFGVAGVLVDLHESLCALEAFLILWPETSGTSGVTAHTYVVDFVVEETHGFAVADTYIALFSGAHVKHAWVTGLTFAFRGP